MICPECLTEYVPETKICADCLVSLVDAEPLDLPLTEINWVALDPVDGKVYAEMIAEILDKENIPNYLKSDWASSSFNISPANLIGSTVTIYVPDGFQEKAAEILHGIVG